MPRLKALPIDPPEGGDKVDSKGQGRVSFIFACAYKASGLIGSLCLDIATEMTSNLVNTLWELG